MEYNGKKQIINQLSEKDIFFNKKYKNFFTYKIIPSSTLKEKYSGRIP